MRKGLILLLVFLAGCAAPWQRAGGTFRGADYTVSLPEGWMFLNTGPAMLITREGEVLQNILVFVIDLDQQDRNAKKILRRDMLPQETAEVVMDILQADQRMSQLAVVENRPVTVNGLDGFRIVYTYKSQRLNFKVVYYGFLQDDKFYRLSYGAPVRHYFDRDLPAFEKIVAGFLPLKKDRR